MAAAEENTTETAMTEEVASEPSTTVETETTTETTVVETTAAQETVAETTTETAIAETTVEEETVAETMTETAVAQETVAETTTETTDIISVVLPTSFNVTIRPWDTVDQIYSDDILVCNTGDFPVDINVTGVTVSSNIEGSNIRMELLTSGNEIQVFEISEEATENITSFTLSEKQEETDLAELNATELAENVVSGDYAIIRFRGKIDEETANLWQDGDLKINIVFSFSKSGETVETTAQADTSEPSISGENTVEITDEATTEEVTTETETDDETETEEATTEEITTENETETEEITTEEVTTETETEEATTEEAAGTTESSENVISEAASETDETYDAETETEIETEETETEETTTEETSTMTESDNVASETASELTEIYESETEETEIIEIGETEEETETETETEEQEEEKQAPDDVISIVLPTSFDITMNPWNVTEQVSSSDITICNKSTFPVDVQITSVDVSIDKSSPDGDKKGCDIRMELLTSDADTQVFDTPEGVSENITSFTMAGKTDEETDTDESDVDDYAVIRFRGMLNKEASNLWRDGDLKIKVVFSFSKHE
jgi:hypothetical protein